MKLRKGVKRAAGFDKAALCRLPTSERYAGSVKGFSHFPQFFTSY